MNELVLVIDDEPIVRETVIRVLEAYGYRTVTAVNGRQGERKFETDRPDLVLIDVIMPEQEGIETIINLRRKDPAVKIIAMSGGGRVGNKSFLDLAKALGADAVIDKPFTADALHLLIRNVLGAS